MNDHAIAIVVTFHPGLDVAGNVAALKAEGLRVIVVHNGGEEPRADSDIILIRNGENLGVATALNVGVRRAIEDGAQWIFTFDQDSRVEPGFADRMFGAWALAEARFGRVGILAPTYVDAPTGRKLSGANGGTTDVRRVATTMTSGNLLNARTFDVVGPYRDDYFIDYVDVEFSLRCRRAGLAVVQTSSATLRHNLGTTRWKNVLGVPFKLVDQPPARRYYMTRNRLRTYRAYGAFDALWLAQDLRMLLFEEAKLLLFERQRLEKLRAQARGVADAIKGTTGRQP